ncbi:peptidylprolyl isomerase [Persicobacter sp. CCB-QB2]|uniref:peptidylprolyl isomerase n=1 Tax=Persicobacter sp. CCB-QB2 TaxID=1561025 RepID=UPI0009E22DC4|nr:peptidylprolyl isomerase [Persicobacter sp. CCB-QB2]
MKPYFSFIFFAIVFLSCNPYSSDQGKVYLQWKEIHEFQNQRNTDTLLYFLKSDQADIRRSAARALGSVQDEKALNDLKFALADDQEEVRAAAAFALGQLAKQQAFPSLQAALLRSQEESTLEEIRMALGKCLAPKQVGVLLDQPASPGNLRALTYAAQNGAYNDQVQAYVLTCLQDENGREVQSLAANILARNIIDQQDLIPQIQALFEESDNKETRCHLLEAYGKMKGNAGWLKYVLDKQTLAPMEKCAAIRAIGKDWNSSDIPLIKKLLKDPLYNVASIMVSALPEADWVKSDWALEMPLMIPKAQWLGKTGDMKLISSALDTARNVYVKGELWKAYARFPTGLEALQEGLARASVPEQAFVFEAIIEWANQFPEQSKSDLFKRVLWQGMQSRDVAMIYYGALWLQSNWEDYSDWQLRLSELKNELKLPIDLEAYNELEGLLAKMEGRTPNKANPADMLSIDWQQLSFLPPHPQFEFYTTQGGFVLELLPEAAPAAVTAFLKLWNEGFYEGKTFHRVVPGFVAQGACPRGDGFGGMNWVIPSEFDEHQFEAGSVGLASAGKDTESCQFFINYTSTPRLDGRYTIFAKVVYGMETVERLGVGDQIMEVKFKKK